jgi:DNA polymerase-4
MASDFEKPDKIHTLFINQIEEKLWPLPARSLFSVGRVTSELLGKAGIYTIGDIANSDRLKIQALLGAKPGQQIYNYANGIDSSPVLKGGREAKGYSNSTTLDKDITSAEDAYRVLMALTDVAASRMRADGVKAYCVSVTIRDNFFKDRSHQKSLSAPTDITREIYDISTTLFSQLWDKKTPIRLLAVALTDLTKQEEVQQSFFHDEIKEKDAKIDKAVDSIRSKFGTDTIMRGSVLSSELNVSKKDKPKVDN